jgi:hypothetical protein
MNVERLHFGGGVTVTVTQLNSTRYPRAAFLNRLAERLVHLPM